MIRVFLSPGAGAGAPFTMLPSDFADLWSADRGAQNSAFHDVIALTKQPVDWAYEAWDEVLGNLTHEDNHNRAIAAQLLCNLAKSDPESRLLRDFDALFAVKRDARFVTARHCTQSLWKVGAVRPAQRKVLVAALASRFRDCAGEKHHTLIRYDIVERLRRLYDATGEAGVKAKALELVALEDDTKYRAKYARLWKAT